MPQPLTVKAFRKRAQKMGYTSISIIEIKPVSDVRRYRVTACEPLTRAIVTAEYDITSLAQLMRGRKGGEFDVK